MSKQRRFPRQRAIHPRQVAQMERDRELRPIALTVSTGTKQETVYITAGRLKQIERRWQEYVVAPGRRYGSNLAARSAKSMAESLVKVYAAMEAQEDIVLSDGSILKFL